VGILATLDPKESLPDSKDGKKTFLEAATAI